MNLLTSPNKWSCLLTSFAMILDKTLEQLIKILGHDGSEILWPNLIEPLSRRAFHIQEMIDIAYILGYSCTPFDAIPSCRSSPDSEIRMPEMWLMPQERINMVLINKGVLTGVTKNNTRHAVAWNGKKVYDPNGSIYDLDSSGFGIQTFWVISKSNQE